MAGRAAVVDGDNVAWEERTAQDKPRVANVVAMRRVLEEAGYDPLIVVGAALRHEIDDPGQLEALIDSGTIHQAPAGTQADDFVLQLARQRDAVVVSNDTFGEWRSRYPDLTDRLLPFMVVEGDVLLSQPAPEESREAGGRDR